MNQRDREYIAAHRGDSAASIAAALQNDPRFAQRIEGSAMRGYFGRTTVEQRLEDAAQALGPGALGYGIRRTLKAANAADGYIDLLDPGIALEFRSSLPLLQGEGVLTAQEVADFLAMGGGSYYTPLTEAEVQAELDRLDALDAAFALRQQWAAVYNAGVALIDSGAQSGDLPTLAELRAVEG